MSQIALAAASAVPVLFGVASVAQADYTWDSTGTNASSPVDGTGTWNTTTATNWSNGTLDSVWPNDFSNAIFGNGGTAGTVTATVPLNVGNITFNSVSGSYLITAASSSDVITLSGGIFVNNSAFISAPLGGSSGLAVTTSGTSYTLNLSGVETYSGNTVLSGGGVLQLGADNVLPAAANFTISGGSLFDLNTHAQTVASLTGTSSDEVALNSGTLTINQATASTSTYSGYILGSVSNGTSGTLVKQGAGQFNWAAPEGTFTTGSTASSNLDNVANVVIANGRFQIGATGAASHTSDEAFSANTVVTFGQTGQTGTGVLDLYGQSQNIGGLVTSPSATGTYTITDTNTSGTTPKVSLTVSVPQGQTYTFGNTANATASINEPSTGPAMSVAFQNVTGGATTGSPLGTEVLTSQNTWNGVAYIGDGETLKLGVDNALPIYDGNAATHSIFMQAPYSNYGGILDLNGHIQNEYEVYFTGEPTPGSIINSSATPATLQSYIYVFYDGTIGSNITLTTSPTSPNTITAPTAAPGILKYYRTNGTNVNLTLFMNATIASSLPIEFETTTSTSYATKGDFVQIGTGGTTGTLGTGPQAVIFDGPYTAAGSTSQQYLLFDRSDSYTVSGSITAATSAPAPSSSNLGSGVIEQFGTGTITLAGTNTYSGGTMIANGTLAITSDAALGNTSVYGISFATSVVNLTDTSNPTEPGGTLQFVNYASTSLPAFNNMPLLKLGAATGASSSLASLITGTSVLNYQGPGTLSLLGANTFTGGTSVNAGTLEIGSTGSLPGGTITVAASSTLKVDNGGTISSATSPAALTINGSVIYASQSTATLTAAIYSSLTIAGPSNAWTGLLDLANKPLVVHNGSLSTLTSEIKEGYSNGTWTGTGGITSSSAKAAVTSGNGITALGIELNNDGTGHVLLSSFEGQTVTNTDVLIKYTFYGDADLSGTVTGSDYTLIDNGFNNTLTGWHNGDFNYDGVVNGNDYTLIDNAFNNQATIGPLLTSSAPANIIATNTAQVAPSVSAVPEPGSLTLLAIGSALGLRRRRRSR